MVRRSCEIILYQGSTTQMGALMTKFSRRPVSLNSPTQTIAIFRQQQQKYSKMQILHSLIDISFKRINVHFLVNRRPITYTGFKRFLLI